MGINPKRFISSVAECLFCPICKQVLERPISLCHEQHIFCAECVSEEFDTCPAEGCIETMPVDGWDLRDCKPYWRNICSLECKCKNYEEGCEWTGTLQADSDEPHHLQCIYRTAPCPNQVRGCLETIQFRNVDSHREDCIFDWIECPRGKDQCGPKFRVSELETHEDVCNQWKCPNLVCTTTATRAVLATHKVGCDTNADAIKSLGKFIDFLQKQNVDLATENQQFKKQLEHLASNSPIPDPDVTAVDLEEQIKEINPVHHLQENPAKEEYKFPTRKSSMIQLPRWMNRKKSVI